MVVDDSAASGAGCRCFNMWLLTLTGAALAVGKAEHTLQLKPKEVYEFTVLIHQSAVPKKLWEEATLAPKDACQAVLELVLGDGIMKGTQVHTAFVHKQSKPAKEAASKVEPMVQGFFRLDKVHAVPVLRSSGKQDVVLKFASVVLRVLSV